MVIQAPIGGKTSVMMKRAKWGTVWGLGWGTDRGWWSGDGGGEPRLWNIPVPRCVYIGPHCVHRIGA